MASPGLGMDGDAAGSAGANALAEGHPQATVEEYIRIFEAHKSGEGGSSATSVLGSLLENETDGEILKCFHGEAGAWDEFNVMRKGRLNRTSCLLTPKTCAAIEDYVEITGTVDGQLISGEVAILRTRPAGSMARSL